MVRNIMVVGAGLTGALCASFSRLLVAQKDAVTILEKSRGAGGRMSTSRCYLNEDKSEVGYVDLGAQYISVKPEYATRHARFLAELQDAKVLIPFTGTIDGFKQAQHGDAKNYVTPNGISSVAKFYLHNSGATVRYERHVSSVDINVPEKMCTVSTLDGTTETCDVVILTMPVPQILALKGNITNLIESSGHKQKLQDVSYSSRYALGLFYKNGTHIDVPWCMKYCDDPVIRYIAIDNKKRQGNGSPSICVHTSVPYGIANLERDSKEVEYELLTRLRKLLPTLPEPEEVKLHKWKYSQVSSAYIDAPGCITLSECPLVILAGDAFVHSNFNGCVESAIKVSEVLESNL